MATYKILGQKAPETTWLNLYSPGSGKTSVVSSMTLCGLGGLSDYTLVSVRIVSGGSTGSGGTAGTLLSPLDKEYLFKDVLVNKNETVVLTLGVTLNGTDILAVIASNSGANVAVNAFGTEA